MLHGQRCAPFACNSVTLLHELSLAVAARPCSVYHGVPLRCPRAPLRHSACLQELDKARVQLEKVSEQLAQVTAEKDEQHTAHVAELERINGELTAAQKHAEEAQQAQEQLSKEVEAAQVAAASAQAERDQVQQERYAAQEAASAAEKKVQELQQASEASKGKAEGDVAALRSEMSAAVQATIAAGKKQVNSAKADAAAMEEKLSRELKRRGKDVRTLDPPWCSASSCAAASMIACLLHNSCGLPSCLATSVAKRQPALQGIPFVS
jgi:CCR4-NOT transcriptional regulation complex NOT5 subunit